MQTILIPKRKCSFINRFTPKQAILNILLCLTPDDFTCQWGTPRSQWVSPLTVRSEIWGGDFIEGGDLRVNGFNLNLSMHLQPISSNKDY